MFIRMPQLGTQMTPMPIPQHTMPSMMVTSVGTMSQNLVDVSVAATTIKRTQFIETDPVFPNMTRGMPYSTPGHTVESLATFRQQVKESHHSLMNMLTHQMATSAQSFDLVE